MNEFLCVQCATKKHTTEFNKKGEHILPFGFGNDGKTDAVLKNQICLNCNQNYGLAIDKPFLRHVKSRDIQNTHSMKRRHAKTELQITGGGVIVRYGTSTAHLLECIKIAFETHVKFLSEEYRDDVFQTLHQLLNDIIAGYNDLRISMKNQVSHGRTFDAVWADTGQGIIIAKYFNIINNSVYRLDEITSNSAEIVREMKSRSKDNSYASLIQLGCFKFGVAAMICLQSLPPLVVHVCNQRDRYINEFGINSIHVMDLRSSLKWVGIENQEFSTNSNK